MRIINFIFHKNKTKLSKINVITVPKPLVKNNQPVSKELVDLIVSNKKKSKR